MKSALRHAQSVARLLLLAVAIAASIPSCRGAMSDDVPVYLWGTWRTTAARYADRDFEMEAHVLRLGLGQGEVVSHAVTGVEIRNNGGSERCRVHYREPEGAESVLSFDFDGKAIRFVNQPEIAWHRDPAEVRQ